MNEIIHKNAKRFLASIGALLLCFSSVTVPCFADTTYYSYNYFGLRSNGNVTGINLNVSTIHPVVLSVNNSGYVSYYLAFCLYAGGYSSSSAAQSYANLYANLTGVNKYSNNSNSLSWTYSNTVSGGIGVGSFINSNGKEVYYYYSFIMPFTPSATLYADPSRGSGDINGAFGVYCNGNTDLWTYVTYGNVASSTAMDKYVKYKLSSALPTDYAISTVPAKTWLKTSETITPSINESLLSGGDGSTSDSGGNAGPSATSDPGTGGGSGSGSGGSMSQTQSIASGAVAFTVEDGAFSQTQSQTIESDAVNVTVTNNNELTNENLNHINQIINNNPETTENTFQDAIANMNQFRAMAAAFAALAGVVLGWLPSWVTGLIGLSFSILSIMIIFRLIHLFV